LSAKFERSSVIAGGQNPGAQVKLPGTLSNFTDRKPEIGLGGVSRPDFEAKGSFENPQSR